MWCPSRLLKFLALSCLVFVPQLQNSVEAIKLCDQRNTPMFALAKHPVSKYYYIGSVFALHDVGKTFGLCGKVLQRGLQLTEAFLWYLDKHQVKDSDISTGGLVFDSCSDSNLVLQQLVSFETNQTSCVSNQHKQIEPATMLAYVGGDRLTDTVALAEALKRTDKSILSPIGNTMLPDKYPYFFQDAPRYSNSSQFLVTLLKDNNIDFVIVLYQNEEFWINRSKEFVKQANASKICSVYNASISANAKDYDTVFQQLQAMKITVYVVIIADDNVISSVLMAANLNSIQLNSFVFLAIGITVHNHNFNSIKSVIIIPTVSATDIINMANEFHNNYKQIGANKINKPWIEEYCQQNNKPNCSGVFTKEKLDPTVPFLFLSLRSVMFAIHDLTKDCKYFCKGVKGKTQQAIASITLDVDGATQSVFDSEKFLHSSFVKYKLKITNVSSLAEFNSGKKLDILKSVSECPSNPCVECMTSPIVPPVTVTFATASTTQRPASSSFASMVVPKVNFQTGFMGVIAMRSTEEFGVRNQKWIIPLGVLASLGVLSVMVFEIYILYKLLGTKLGRQWRTMWLGQLLLFGVLLCYLTLFAYLPTPTDTTCGITRFGVGFSYAVVFSVMLVKLMVILTSKTTEETYQTEGVASNYLRGTYQILMFIFALGVQLVIDIQWLITIPPRAVPITDVTDDSKVWICNHYTWSTEAGPDKSKQFSRNEFENHLLTLVYVMFLILLTTGVSMKAHGIVTNHRESIFIGLSAGLSIPLWVAWGLIGGLNRNSPLASQYGDACIAFGLFLNATLILFAMFLPKVRQLVNMGLEGVYLEDDRDTAYAESVISYKTGYRSNPGPFMNGGGSIYNGSIRDPMALHLKHPGSVYDMPTQTRSRPASVYDTGSRMLKVTPDLTGRINSDRRRAVSEMNYNTSMSAKPRSERGSILSRSRSTQDLGAL